jgi:hypothetical protein
MKIRRVVLLSIIFLFGFCLMGCQVENPVILTEPAPTETQIPPSATQAPTDTLKPTSTEIPTATPTPPEPTITAQAERLAESLDEFVGVWRGYWSDANMIYTEFMVSGQARLTWERGGVINVEWFTFENGTLTWGKITYAESNPQVCWDNPEASYEVYITKRGEQPENLRFKLISQDQCSDRKEFYDGKTFRWVGTEIP